MARKPYYIKTIKKLFALSGNQCAFNYKDKRCNQEIINSKGHVIGEICHIEAANKNGIRYNPNSNDDYRRSFKNLILLCPNHHKLIDADDTFSVYQLQQMKSNHDQENFTKINTDLINSATKELEKTYSSLIELISKDSKKKSNKELIESLIDTGNFRKAEEILSNSILKSEEDLANSALQLALLLELQFKYHEAVKQYEKAIKFYPENIEYNLRIGTLYSILDESIKAIEYYQKVIVLIEDKKENLELLPWVYNNLGMSHSSIGNYSEAFDFIEKALAIDINKFGPIHPDVAIRYNNLGAINKSLSNYNQAVEYYLKALKIDTANYGEASIQAAKRYTNLGAVLYHLGNYNVSIIYFEKAIQIISHISKVHRPELGNAYLGLGELYLAIDQNDKAIELNSKALEIYTNCLGEHHSYNASVYNNIGVAYNNKGNYEESIIYYKKSLAINRMYYDEIHKEIGINLNNIGASYLKNNSFLKAEEYITNALSIQLKIFGEKHFSTAVYYNNLGAIKSNTKQYREAITYFEKALRIGLDKLDATHPTILKFEHNINFNQELLNAEEL